MQTTTFIKQCRALTKQINSTDRVLNNSERELIQQQLDAMKPFIKNPTLSCLLDLKEAGEKHGLDVQFLEQTTQKENFI